MLTLYSYFRSGASHRVRIALNVKQLDYTISPVHLINNQGEHRQSAYAKKNPQQLLPSLELDDGQIITQSLAIIDFLEHRYPQHSVYPKAPLQRAKAMQIAHCLAMEAQPLQNLRVLEYLESNLGFDADKKQRWIQHWMKPALHSVEHWIEPQRPNYCVADQISIADLVLIPQLYAAQRFGVELNNYPKIARIFEHCNQLPAFIKAAPQNQIDAPKLSED